MGSTDVMILKSAQRTACLRWTELGLNPGFHSKMLPTKCLTTVWPSCILQCLHNLQFGISIAVNIQCGLLGYDTVWLMGDYISQ